MSGRARAGVGTGVPGRGCLCQRVSGSWRVPKAHEEYRLGDGGLAVRCAGPHDSLRRRAVLGTERIAVQDAQDTDQAWKLTR